MNGDLYLDSGSSSFYSKFKSNVETLSHKVVATSIGSSPEVSKIPIEFIRKFVEEWNKGNMISELDVEFEEFISTNPNPDSPTSNTILNAYVDRCNQVTVTKVKDLWCKTEIIEFMSKYWSSVIYPKVQSGLVMPELNKLKLREWLDKNI